MLHDNQHYKELVKEFDTFLFRRDKTQVFESLIDYCVYGFCVNSGCPSWPFSKEDTATIAKMFSLWILAAKDEIDKRGWADIPGNLHQSCIYTGGSKGFLGQYFTPEDVATLMARITLTPSTGKEDSVTTVSDPACGSGRMLLAQHILLQEKNIRDHCVAQDIDPICVKMCVANFLMHGVEGEVICGNTLIAGDRRFAFVVNEHLNDPASKLFGIPHCRFVDFAEKGLS